MNTYFCKQLGAKYVQNYNFNYKVCPKLNQIADPKKGIKKMYWIQGIFSSFERFDQKTKAQGRTMNGDEGLYHKFFEVENFFIARLKMLHSSCDDDAMVVIMQNPSANKRRSN